MKKKGFFENIPVWVFALAIMVVYSALMEGRIVEIKTDEPE